MIPIIMPLPEKTKYESFVTSTENISDIYKEMLALDRMIQKAPMSIRAKMKYTMLLEDKLTEGYFNQERPSVLADFIRQNLLEVPAGWHDHIERTVTYRGKTHAHSIKITVSEDDGEQQKNAEITYSIRRIDEKKLNDLLS